MNRHAEEIGQVSRLPDARAGKIEPVRAIRAYVAASWKSYGLTAHRFTSKYIHFRTHLDYARSDACAVARARRRPVRLQIGHAKIARDDELMIEVESRIKQFEELFGCIHRRARLIKFLKEEAESQVPYFQIARHYARPRGRRRIFAHRLFHLAVLIEKLGEITGHYARAGKQSEARETPS
jgi:hypothetical protein